MYSPCSRIRIVSSGEPQASKRMWRFSRAFATGSHWPICRWNSGRRRPIPRLEAPFHPVRASCSGTVHSTIHISSPLSRAKFTTRFISSARRKVPSKTTDFSFRRPCSASCNLRFVGPFRALGRVNAFLEGIIPVLFQNQTRHCFPGDD